MNGIERAKLQSKIGTRSIVENLDELRIKYGFDTVIVHTPIVESKLRFGLVPARSLIVSVKLPSSNELEVYLTFPIGFPTNRIQVLVKYQGIDLSDEEEMVENIINDIYGACSNESSQRFIARNIVTQVEQYYKDSRITDNLNGRSVNSMVIEDDTQDDEERAYVNMLKNSEEAADATVENDSDRIEKDPTLPYFLTCMKCGRVVLESKDLHDHSIDQKLNKRSKAQCTSYFAEEAPNYVDTREADAGKIHCGKCSARIGSWSWVGSACSCGEWIAPSFQIVKSKVDKKLIT